MALLEQWRSMAYNEDADRNQLQKMWNNYFNEEKGIYIELLKNPNEVVKGTVKELADKFGVTVMTMTGFLDGANDSLVTPNPIEEMEEDTEVALEFDLERLYK
ncbi:MAG: SEC-C domain-containing protein, partial [Lachnospiraceae bacterium]|nr:SEC-C domain-containing protein [Lachnospiraceae bacterium]